MRRGNNYEELSSTAESNGGSAGSLDEQGSKKWVAGVDSSLSTPDTEILTSVSNMTEEDDGSHRRAASPYQGRVSVTSTFDEHDGADQSPALPSKENSRKILGVAANPFCGGASPADDRDSKKPGVRVDSSAFAPNTESATPEGQFVDNERTAAEKGGPLRWTRSRKTRLCVEVSLVLVALVLFIAALVVSIRPNGALSASPSDITRGSATGLDHETFDGDQPLSPIDGDQPPSTANDGADGYDGSLEEISGSGDLDGSRDFGGSEDFAENTEGASSPQEGGGTEQATSVTTAAATPQSDSSTKSPTDSLSQPPTSQPTEVTEATYRPGRLIISKLGIKLSKGLDIRVIAKTGSRVQLKDGDRSEREFHELPDGAACFPVPPNSPYNATIPGGWAYTSNSNVENGGGSVGSLYFDKDGNIVDYKRLLGGTDQNCGGGKTPWGTWISCEQPLDREGEIYEVDPFSPGSARKTTLDDGGGRYGAFAYDVRNETKPRFFYTEDHQLGPLRRFTPNDVDWDDPSDMLHGEGEITYLVIEPAFEDADFGTFYWSPNRSEGEKSASRYFPNNEGIDVLDGKLYFTNAWWLLLYSLDLDAGNWTSTSTIGGAFDGMPDQLVRPVGGSQEILYFTEDGESSGAAAGVHGRDEEGNFFSIIESEDWEESSGLAFSPNGMRMYVAWHQRGIVYEIWREDGLPFTGRSARIKYHDVVGEPVPGWDGEIKDYWD